MNLTNEYYYFTEALDKETCDKIIKAGERVFGEATVGQQLTPLVDKKIRNNATAWSEDQWLYDLIWPYMQSANAKSGWGYDIEAAESVQITRYEKGEFYNFHKDGISDNLGAYNLPEDKFKHGNVRKLSMSIILNEGYEGGGFEFATINSSATCAEELSTTYTPDFNKLGSIIVFPSYMMHRVQPVTKGTRYSLVSWFLGPPFK